MIPFFSFSTTILATYICGVLYTCTFMYFCTMYYSFHIHIHVHVHLYSMYTYIHVLYVHCTCMHIVHEIHVHCVHACIHTSVPQPGPSPCPCTPPEPVCILWHCAHAGRGNRKCFKTEKHTWVQYTLNIAHMLHTYMYTCRYLWTGTCTMSKHTINMYMYLMSYIHECMLTSWCEMTSTCLYVHVHACILHVYWNGSQLGLSLILM